MIIKLYFINYIANILQFLDGKYKVNLRTPYNL